MSGITSDPGGSAGEAGGVNVLEGCEGDTNDPLSCFHDVLQRLAAGRGAGTVPHCDAAGEDALNGASVERVRSLRRKYRR